MQLNKNVAVVADTWYENKKLAGENVNITLPSIEWMTQQIKTAGGNVDIPLTGLTDALTCNVSGDGVNSKMKKAITPGLNQHEFRWVKTIVKKDGSVTNIGCKAFLKMMSLNIPEVGVEPEEAQESSYDYSVIRYHLYEDGKEVFLIDKLNGTCRINGKEYNTKQKNYLY